MALKEAIKENLYIKSLLNQILAINDVVINDKTLFTDSKSAIELVKNLIHHSKTKHIDIQYYFVRDNYMNDIISLKYCPTEEQLADGLIKVINTDKYLESIKELELKP